MQATSREALSAIREQFDELTRGADTSTLRQLGDDLSGVVGLLSGERVLRRHLSDPAAPESSRRALADRVFDGKVSDLAARALREVVARRWSRTADLLDAVEVLASRSVLAAAEQEGTLDETEDELFRFGRVLGSEGRLRQLLGDGSTSADQRLRLLHQVLQGKVGADTLHLLEQPVRAPRERGLDVVIGQLAELAASRRDQSVAQVTVAAPLSEEQERRLAGVLSRIYGKTMSIQVEVDPEVIGGLVVRVGDEVIDGSVVSRLAKASQELPS